MIGRFLGAGSTADARSAGRRLLWWGVGAGVVLGLLVALARPWLPELFTDDAAVASLATFLLIWVAALQPVNGVVFVLDGLLIGAGDMGFLAWAMWIAFGVFAVGAVAVLVLGLGIGWLWASLAALMLSRLTVLGLRWRTDRWAVTGAAR